jgi:hypothetical protein
MVLTMLKERCYDHKNTIDAKNGTAMQKKRLPNYIIKEKKRLHV